jgi:plastocyanin
MRTIRRFAAALGITAILALVAYGPGDILLHSRGANAQATIAVETGDDYFSPVQMTIHAGDTVTWTNVGGAAHTITPADGSSWGTDDLEPGATYSFTFAQAGTYQYKCLLHADHAPGSILVQ